jgi:UPF0716 protein FxsA
MTYHSNHRHAALSNTVKGAAGADSPPDTQARHVRLFSIPILIIAYMTLEIACLIAVGGQIGVLGAIGLIFATALLGAVLLRVQGFGILNRIRSEMDAGRVPSREMAHGVMIMFAGVLLMIPGFVSDVLGLLLFIPAFRDLGWSLIRNRIRIVSTTSARGSSWQRQSQPVIDLEADEYSRNRDRGADRTRLPPDRD